MLATSTATTKYSNENTRKAAHRASVFETGPCARPKKMHRASAVPHSPQTIRAEPVLLPPPPPHPVTKRSEISTKRQQPQNLMHKVPSPLLTTPTVQDNAVWFLPSPPATSDSSPSSTPPGVEAPSFLRDTAASALEIREAPLPGAALASVGRTYPYCKNTEACM